MLPASWSRAPDGANGFGFGYGFTRNPFSLCKRIEKAIRTAMYQFAGTCLPMQERQLPVSSLYQDEEGRGFV